MAQPALSFDKIRLAYELIRNRIKKTPVICSDEFNKQFGRKFYFKAENLQVTGSFKVRGALHAVLCLKDRDSSFKGLITTSSGNHGRAMSWISQELDIPCTVVVPSTAPNFKRQAISKCGANIVVASPALEERLKMCHEMEETDNLRYISSSDDYDVMAGQGTVGLEFLEQVPHLDAILVPVSGGGLAAGVCVAAKAIKPDIKIFIVEPRGKDVQRCFNAGERLWPVPSHPVNTIADGLINQPLGYKNFPILCQLAEKRVLTVDNPDIVKGVEVAISQLKLAVEPSGVTPIAAVMKGLLSDLGDEIQHIGLVLTGGNMDWRKVANL